MELKYSQFMFLRSYEPLDAYFQPNKVLVIYVPRRDGKTTLLKNYLDFLQNADG